MPIYNFIDTNTNEEFELFMKISEREEYLQQNPHIQKVITTPMIVSSISTKNRVPDGFKEVLSKVAESHPNSEVGNRYGRKSIKDVKTRNIVKKHVEKLTKT